MLFTYLASLSLNGAVVVWDGDANKGDWSGSGGKGNNGNNNWVGNTAPKNGDSLIFSNAVRLTNSNNINNLSVESITFDDTAGDFVLGGKGITLTGNITNNSTSLQTIHMALGLSSGDHAFATLSGNMAIDGIISGSGNFIKTGNRQLILKAKNTYTGTTTVSQGTLLVNNQNGSATGTGSVNVGSSATLGGTGIIQPGAGKNVTVSGNLAPGNGSTPGTLTFNFSSTTGGLTMNSGAGFEFHLGNAGVSLNSIGVSDMLAITGASSGDVAFNHNMINFMGTGQVGFYKLFDTSSNDSNTWSGLTVNLSGQITDGLAYYGLSNGFTAIFFMGGYEMGGTNGDIYVQVIPEPSTTLLGGLGVISLLLRRCRPSRD